MPFGYGEDEFEREPAPRDWQGELAEMAGVEVPPPEPPEPEPEPEALALEAEAAVEEAVAAPIVLADHTEALERVEARLDALGPVTAEVRDLVLLIGTTTEQLGRRQLELQAGLDALRERPDPPAAPAPAVSAVSPSALDSLAAVLDRIATTQEAIVAGLDKLGHRLDHLGHEPPPDEDPMDERRATITRRLAEAQVQLTDSHAALAQSVYGMHHEVMEIRAAVTQLTKQLLS
jgi:hypothetical protein